MITVLHKTLEEKIENPYNDRMSERCLLYTGEGRVGNQKMERGNLALKMQMEKKYPVYVFEKKTPGRYMFLGQFDVKSVHEENQPDANGSERKVYLFKLEMVSDLAILP
ncbi:MAG: YDG/SRA domain-containing protein [Nitrososphaerota archaeon]|nr:YDG/SRA domain-containing protein [Candidatus Bathyarchaeota archaeon]MDW8023448.1 YDG/SRA domain-containing protein [Nitrososphaerota archaeon]